MKICFNPVLVRDCVTITEGVVSYIKAFPVNVYVLIEILFEETTTILNWNKLFFKISFFNCLVFECLYYKSRAFIFMFCYLKHRGN